MIRECGSGFNAERRCESNQRESIQAGCGLSLSVCVYISSARATSGGYLVGRELFDLVRFGEGEGEGIGGRQDSMGR